MGKYFEVLLVFLKLGLTSFGGPVAHLGFFHHTFVKEKKWLSDHSYSDLVTLCQFLPGPASSQVGMAIGLSRAGILGAICAWIGFTLPSAVILIFFGLGLTHLSPDTDLSWLHGLKIVAVAVVAQAIFSMSKKLCPDVPRILLALSTAALVIAFPSPLFQIGALIFAGVVGIIFFKVAGALPHTPFISDLSKKRASVFLVIFIALLILLPFMRSINSHHALKEVDSFYRAGSLVFGGGHVVLPLLQSEVVQSGWVSKELFTAGYGLSQAIPGPLFSFTAYLGAVSKYQPNAWSGAVLCLVAAFLPSFLLILGIMPFWEELRKKILLRQAMVGLSAGVVGILLAAFIDPIWRSAIFGVKDFILASLFFGLLEFARFPAWLVVLLGVLTTAIIG